jgi:hypothetical protein
MADRRTRVNTKTASTWTSTNTVLAEGEVGHESDTGKIKVGDGSTAWSSLSYTSATADTASATNFTNTLQVNGSDVTTDADIGSTIQAYDANLTGFVAACNLPTSDGTADQVLKTDGAGTISFATQSGGSLSDQGVTASVAELNYCDGVTSNIQTQLDGKQAADSNLSSFLTALDLPTSDGTSGQVLSTDGAGNISWSSAGAGASSSGSVSYSSLPIQIGDGSGGFTNNANLTLSGDTTPQLQVGQHSGSNHVSYVATWGITGAGQGGTLQNQVRAPGLYIKTWNQSRVAEDTPVFLLGAQNNYTGGVNLVQKYIQQYGVIWATSEDDYGYQGFDANTYKGAYIKTGKVIDRNTTVSGNGTQTYDCEYGFNFIHSSATANWTVNLTKTKTVDDNHGKMANNVGGVWSSDFSVQVKILVTQGATPYMPTALQIEGTALTIDWEGGSAPSGTASGKDLVTFDIYHGATLGASTVLGSSRSFS